MLCPGPVAYAFVAFFPDSLDHPPYLSVTEADQTCNLYLRDLFLQCLMNEMETLYFPSAHGDHVLFCHNALLDGQAL